MSGPRSRAAPGRPWGARTGWISRTGGGTVKARRHSRARADQRAPRRNDPVPATACHDLDITRDVCPMTFVRARLELDRMPSGALLRVRLRGEEPRRNIVRNARALGHEVLADEPETRAAPDAIRLVTIRKG